VGASFLAVSCGSGNEAEVQSAHFEANVTSHFTDKKILSENRFQLITPTGAKIFAAGKEWEKKQELQANYFAKPAMCATNASKVLEMAGVHGYSSPLLMNMVNSAKKRGAWVINLPKNRFEIAAKLKQIFNGKIPVGSFVSGCLRPDCSGQAGDGHIALIGDVDSSGYIKIYHNNWYRPDNHSDRIWRPYMIPMDWYNKGYRRKWMATPWIYIHRDQNNSPRDISVPLPEIDDLDPTNYYLTLTIPSEILHELRMGQGVITDGKGGVTDQAGKSVLTDNRSCSGLTIFDANDPLGVNLRESSSGQILCQIPNGTSATLIEKEGLWSRVSVQCGGIDRVGLVFSALTQANSCH
jgi:hypothetical protein